MSGGTAGDRLARWESSQPFHRVADSFCHLDQLRQRLPLGTADLRNLAAGRRQWPELIITNFQTATNYDSQEELEVG
jgi:hypothetical protein